MFPFYLTVQYIIFTPRNCIIAWVGVVCEVSQKERNHWDDGERGRKKCTWSSPSASSFIHNFTHLLLFSPLSSSSSFSHFLYFDSLSSRLRNVNIRKFINFPRWVRALIYRSCGGCVCCLARKREKKSERILIIKKKNRKEPKENERNLRDRDSLSSTLFYFAECL